MSSLKVLTLYIDDIPEPEDMIRFRSFLRNNPYSEPRHLSCLCSPDRGSGLGLIIPLLLYPSISLGDWSAEQSAIAIGEHNSVSINTVIIHLPDLSDLKPLQSIAKHFPAVDTVCVAALNHGDLRVRAPPLLCQAMKLTPRQLMSHLAASLSPLKIKTVAIAPCDELEIHDISALGTPPGMGDGWRSRLAEEWAQTSPMLEEVIFPDGVVVTRKVGGPWEEEF